jgi:hypothetical protein
MSAFEKKDARKKALERERSILSSLSNCGDGRKDAANWADTTGGDGGTDSECCRDDGHDRRDHSDGRGHSHRCRSHGRSDDRCRSHGRGRSRRCRSGE